MDEIDNIFWNNLAHDTARWMKRIGAIERNKQRGHITVSDWIEEFETIEEVYPENWLRKLVPALFRQGYTVGFDFGLGRGFYLSDSSEAATIVTRWFNYISTLLKTLADVMEAMQESPEWDKIADGFKGRMRLGDLDKLPNLLAGAGIQIPEEVKTALLEAKNKHGK